MNSRISHTARPVGLFFLLTSIWLLPSPAVGQTFTRLFAAGDLGTDQPGGWASAWGDYDLDGFVDLFIVGPANQLYHNNGDGTFSRVTVDHMTTFVGDQNSALWTDVNNDGFPDLYVSHLGPGTPIPPGGQLSPRVNFLYLNDGPPTYGFTRVQSGDLTTTLNMTWTSSFSDYDNDGDVDLFVWGDQGDKDLFYRNNGEGDFESVTGLPFLDPGEFSAGGQLADFDGDGDQDIFVVNFMAANNELYRNMLAETGTATFETITGIPLVNDHEYDLVSSLGDMDNDGDLDIFLPVWLNRNNIYFRNDGDLTFTRLTSGPHVNDQGNSLGNAVFDYDNDGYLDIFVVQQQGVDRLYHNNGDGTFTKMTSDDVGDIISASGSGSESGASVADFDNDGDLDLIGPTSSSGHKLFRNDIGNANNWLEVDLAGHDSNRLGIGAVVRAKAEFGDSEQPIDVWQMRMVHGGPTGDRGQSHQRTHFGFAQTDVVDSLRIEWPSGTVDVLTDVAVNQMMTIEEGSHPESVGTETDSTLPGGIEIGGNYPNPFSEGTRIQFTTDRFAAVRISILDMTGRTRAERSLGWMPPGQHDFALPVDRLESGAYAVRLDAGREMSTRLIMKIQSE